MDKYGYVYILTNIHNAVFYVGVTSDLQRRVWQHRNSEIDGFTKKYRVRKLVYYEVFDRVDDAIVREKVIKGKSRQFKKDLIESVNNDYKDLYDSLL